ncbi:hypothetical protein PCANB_001129 [Pneumocystis canis]|nr:hypothetical protein PCK1_001155 [Pneumocystis canis]KAG5437153.1 hypothetical protein PCANB_001129 [Pneumocystis canis]
MNDLNETKLYKNEFGKNLINRINTFLLCSDINIQKTLENSIDILLETLEKYSFDGISVSFNGGKDALVTLILYFYTVHKYATQQKITLKKIPAIYIQNLYSFPEIEHFVKQCSQDYILDLVYKQSPIKNALKEYLEDHFEIKAILMGARRSDPGCDTLQYFNPTDLGWPSCIRVYPIIDWRYSLIWKFLRGLNVKYCSLYDEGYTSIGCIQDTFPNPELQIDQNKFKPAYELIDEHKERLGRKKKC